MTTKPTWRASLTRWSPALAMMSVLLAAALVFSFPAARAAAQDFLNLFRVKKFTAVTVDPARLQQLQNSNVDLEALIGDNVQKVKDPGAPQTVANAQAASQRAGFQVRTPSQLPLDGKLTRIQVQGEGELRVTANADKANTLLQALGIDDVQVPAKLNGTTVTIKKPAAVEIEYSLSGRRVTFIQSRSPEVVLPDGVDLSQLGEIALRAAGMSKGEAHQFAQSIDWHSTLLVPVPANAGSFREVDVRGNKGLLITNGGTGGPYSGRGQSSIVLWSQGDMVYALEGGIMGVDLLTMANSVE